MCVLYVDTEIISVETNREYKANSIYVSKLTSTTIALRERPPINGFTWHLYGLYDNQMNPKG